jgi:hypothetical protein
MFFIDLDRSTQTFPPWTHHGGAQLLQSGPYHLIAAQLQRALLAEYADSMFLVGHVPGSGAPFLQRNPTAVEDRSRFDQYLAAAAQANPAPICRLPTLSLLTLGTAKPCWLPQLLKIRALASSSANQE